MATDFFGRILHDDLPSPANTPELFDGIFSRRIFAFVIDCIVIGAVMVAAYIVAAILGVLTLGLAWLTFPLITPVVIIGYYLATLGSSTRATMGMRAMDIMLVPTRDAPLDGWMALLHVLLFWLSCTLLTPFILLIGLFTSRRQLLHDLVVGVMMVRRAPYESETVTYTRRTIEG